MKYTLFPLLAAITFSASGVHADSHATPQVAEIVTFHLNDGVNPADFLAAATKTEALLRASGHVLSRTLSRDQSGLWTDYIIWTDQKSAEATAAAVMQNPDFAPFMSMISTKDMVFRYASLVYQMD